jgi:hypothetical protein
MGNTQTVEDCEGTKGKRLPRGDADQEKQNMIRQQSRQLRSRAESVVRVGSQLFSIADLEGENGLTGTTKRATNYDHVRGAAMYNLVQAGVFGLDSKKGVPGVVGVSVLFIYNYCKTSLFPF